MGDQFMGFLPALPKGFEMPPGYHLEGVCGDTADGRRLTYYYWMQGEWPDEERFGPDERDKRKAVRQAWKDYRARRTEDT